MDMFSSTRVAHNYEHSYCTL